MSRMHTRSPSKRAAIRLAIEALENRVLLDGDDLPWRGSPRLMISFVPDGTSIAGAPSGLHAKLDAMSPETEWKEAVLRGFQTWAEHTNLQFGVVSDAGNEMGTPGLTQGDSRFGDIRIGARPLSDNVLAVSIPHGEHVSGTWVGDVIVNSDAALAGLDELYSLMLHEAGHVLGLEHSDDPQSPMHVHGVSPVTSLTDADRSAIQTIFGEIAPDDLESGEDVEPLEFFDGTDNLAADLSWFNLPGQAKGSAPTIVHGNLHHVLDVDWYSTDVPADYDGPLTFVLNTGGISLLKPRIAVYDEDGTLLDEQMGDGSQPLSFQIPAAEHGATYYARVSAAVGDAFGVGAYSLTAYLDDALAVDQADVAAAANGQFWFLEPEEIVEYLAEGNAALFREDGGTDDGPAEANLLESTPGYADQSHYEVLGSIDRAGDVDVYRLRAPQAAQGASVFLSASLFTPTGEEIDLTVRLRENEGSDVATELLLNHYGELAVQGEVSPNRDYLVEIAGASDLTNQNYRLVVSFANQATERLVFAQGTLAANETFAGHSLRLNRSELFQFLLKVDPADFDGELVGELLDEQGGVIASIAVKPGQTRSFFGHFLMPGRYVFRVRRTDGVLGTVPDVQYTLTGSAVADPMGPLPDDPSHDPVDCPQGPPGTTVICFFTGEVWWYGLSYLNGDFDLDGDVDLDDFNKLKGNFGSPGNVIDGDANFDGRTDLADFNIVKQNFGRSEF